ncbi:Bifunctional protein FolC [Candidatus Venteria ishoeyi]|uniref:Dihydrofolate synthase/folylpolyglutamate synthase n=1 Tax=Candidatus Venteria ishoeyi TaxID=1899563 RepID=A0A1H6FAH2_9GAMM|nr:Bifunctional protein FolC [Candidatus Venteria ishoeyi]
MTFKRIFLSISNQNLSDWLNWQNQLHGQAIDLGLERCRSVAERMGLLSPPFTLISVAGTNGKGSSVFMLEQIYRAAGYTCGRYTSPHLHQYNERIVINGETITDEALCASFARIEAARHDGPEISLSYFEFGTLAAIDLFFQADVEIAVLEVGLGGRLDAVNILDADAALITHIDIDHIDWLGDDRGQIALEKAGICRPHHPAVCADPNPPQTLLDFSRQQHIPMLYAETNFKMTVSDKYWQWQQGTKHYANLPLPSPATNWQIRNAAGVLALIETLQNHHPVTENALHEGLQQGQLPARLQQLDTRVPCLLDVAHNPLATRALAETLSGQPCAGQTHALVAMLLDKDIPGTLAPLLAYIDHWHLVELDVERAAPASQLQDYLTTQGINNMTRYDKPRPTFLQLQAQLSPQDRLVVFGSFYTIAAVSA